MDAFRCGFGIAAVGVGIAAQTPEKCQALEPPPNKPFVEFVTLDEKHDDEPAEQRCIETCNCPDPCGWATTTTTTPPPWDTSFNSFSFRPREICPQCYKPWGNSMNSNEQTTTTSQPPCGEPVPSTATSTTTTTAPPCCEPDTTTRDAPWGKMRWICVNGEWRTIEN